MRAKYYLIIIIIINTSMYKKPSRSKTCSTRTTGYVQLTLCVQPITSEVVEWRRSTQFFSERGHIPTLV